MNTYRASRRVALPALAAILVATLAVAAPKTDKLGSACPRGFQLSGIEQRQRSAYGDVLDVPTGVEYCVADKRPESPGEIASRDSQLYSMAAAPDGIIPANALNQAISQRRAIARRGQAAANAKSWQSIGIGPLRSMDAPYGEASSGHGDISGRVSDFFYVDRSDEIIPDTLFATASYGGVWMTDGNVGSWVSVGDNLPTQVVSSVAYTPVGGGTLIVLTGDDSFGADSRRGDGVYYTTNLGRTWTRANGVPGDAFGFKLAVDEARKNVIYAATGTGLYRSIDGGRNFQNVNLPTGDCAGKSNRMPACVLANIVTDVVVQKPGGTTNAAGGKVMAAVGWRGGNRTHPDGTVQSPNNGIYVSETGAPDTFQKSQAIGFALQDRIGRIELGPAEGEKQNHDYIYAMVQDAVLLRNGTPGLDVPAVPAGTVPKFSVFEGLYVSSDFGATWRKMLTQEELAAPQTGTALTANIALGFYGPGVQAWYNVFVRPDPTKASPLGIPTRVVFGLEEVWQNENTNIPQDGRSAFKVIGRYWSGDSCMGLNLPPATTYCATQREGLQRTTTTHPDQHDAIFIPQDDGGVRLVVGNDGGVYSQTIAADTPDYSNSRWGMGNNEGMNTLLPYDAVRSRDGTYWMGLQDNGVAKVVDVVKNGRVVQRQRVIGTKGGDGFFVAVHPDNGNIAYGEYTNGTIASTNNGGVTWTNMSPSWCENKERTAPDLPDPANDVEDAIEANLGEPRCAGITNALFSTPFVMDPLDPNHIMIGGNEIVSTLVGPGTSAESWNPLIDLGTNSKPGDRSAVASANDPAASQTALDLYGAAGYAGFCAPCDVLNQKLPFKNGLATNVGGPKPPKKGSSQGWHIAKAAGLPNRYITSLAIDPTNPRTVYASLGGYYRPWTEPNIVGARNARAGSGHLYVSNDGGNSFRNISKNLPNTPVNWVTLRGKQILVATDIGVFISRADGTFEVLGKNLPMANVHTIKFTNGDPNTLIAAVYGRGIWQYSFGPARKATKVRTIAPPKFLNRVVAGPFGFETSEDGFSAATTGTITFRRIPPGDASTSAMATQGYENEAAVALSSPQYTLPARSAVQVSWSERVDTEPGFDFFAFEWSSDGRRWNQVRAVAGQNAAFPNFSGASAKFVAPAGKLFIRWRLTSDTLLSSPPYTGVAIDNIEIRR